MAVDKGYGSGKSRSAANSRARQRAAAGQMTKGKKGNAALRKIAAENPVTGFIPSMAFPVIKAGKAAAALKSALGAIPATKKAATLAKIAYNDGRVLARIAGRETTSSGGSLINDVAMKNMARQGLRDFENIARPITERLPYALRKANRAGVNSKVVRGVGTVNPEGYAALQKKPDFLGKGAFNVANKNPKRSRRGGR